MASLQEVKTDLAAVEETLLALVAQACPDNESRASGLDAARCLINYAHSTHSGEKSHLGSSNEQPGTDAHPPEVLRSCSALQPLLGQPGVWDALKVLRALRCRMQRLEALLASQPKPCAPSYVQKSETPDVLRGGSAASKPSAASASAVAAAATGAAAEKAGGPWAGCDTDVSTRSAVNCSGQETTHMSTNGAHDAGGSSEQTAQTVLQLQTPEKLDARHRKQLSGTAAWPLQGAAEVRTQQGAYEFPVLWSVQ